MDIRAEGLYEVSSLASRLLDSGLAKKTARAFCSSGCYRSDL
ncbi:hypothetical protein RBSH_03379 [Rhodopirellula baltica SH28]|uniref:Uncharacterized protein n=1 Tax=Rhodopirellula baltica SH28 TaxID=993517 RepID=K5D3W5_RHOBT|nr:hypothetical protein RBSH_03379 [Rhodopirellula baltica SH28]